MDKTEKVSYLWEFSRNLAVPPHRVKVIKECPKTFWIEGVCDTRVNKAERPEPQGYAGYTKYCLYYFTAESAKVVYERWAKEEKEKILHSTPAYKKWQTVKEFAEKVKELSIADMNIGKHYLCISEEAIDELVKEYEIGESK